MEKTAVEWLVEEINKLNVSNEARLFINKLKKQAIQMEKQQIIDACESTDNTDFWVKYESFEQYYNETFKNQLQG